MYVFRCGNDADHARWVDAFRTAARRAPPPLSAKPILAAAFQDAYAAAWRILSLPGPALIDRSEGEQLAVLMLQQLREANGSVAPVGADVEKSVASMAATAWSGYAGLLDLRAAALERMAVHRHRDIEALHAVRMRELRRLNGAELERIVRASVGAVLPTVLDVVAPPLREVCREGRGGGLLPLPPTDCAREEWGSNSVLFVSWNVT